MAYLHFDLIDMDPIISPPQFASPHFETKLTHHFPACYNVWSTIFQLLDCLHKCRKNIPYKTACTNGLPDDEHIMLETRRRHQELN